MNANHTSCISVHQGFTLQTILLWEEQSVPRFYDMWNGMKVFYRLFNLVMRLIITWIEILNQGFVMYGLANRKIRWGIRERHAFEMGNNVRTLKHSKCHWAILVMWWKWRHTKSQCTPFLEPLRTTLVILRDVYGHEAKDGKRLMQDRAEQPFTNRLTHLPPAEWTF